MDIQIILNMQSLKELENKLVDKSSILNKIGNYVVNVVSQNFEEERSADGKKWAKLSSSTLRRAARKTRGKNFKTSHVISKQKNI